VRRRSNAADAPVFQAGPCTLSQVGPKGFRAHVAKAARPKQVHCGGAPGSCLLVREWRGDQGGDPNGPESQQSCMAQFSCDTNIILDAIFGKGAFEGDSLQYLEPMAASRASGLRSHFCVSLVPHLPECVLAE